MQAYFREYIACLVHRLMMPMAKSWIKRANNRLPYCNEIAYP